MQRRGTVISLQGDSQNEQVFQKQQIPPGSLLQQHFTFLDQNRNFEDVFVIQNVSNAEIWDVLFLHSTIPLIKILRDSYISGETDTTYFDNCLFALKSLSTFLEESVHSKTGSSIVAGSRQTLLVELRIIDLLIDLIYSPF